MFVWALLLGGPLVLPLAFALRSDLPNIVAEGMLVAGVVTLFLAICATEAVAAPARNERPADV